MKTKQFVMCLAVFLLTMTVVFMSYWNVRNKAEKIFHPFLESELYYYGTGFHLFTIYKANNKITKWYGPNWSVSYDFQTRMTVGPLSIRYNVFGKILDANPENLLDEIIPKKLKEKQSNN